MAPRLLTKCCHAEVSYQQDATNYYANTKFTFDPDATSWDDAVADYGQVVDSQSEDSGEFVCKGCNQFMDYDDMEIVN